MDVRSSNLKLIEAITGSWDVAAAYVGMTPVALRNRAYHVKGQAIRTDHSLALQTLSGKTCFAEAVAVASGGTFVKLPTDLSNENEPIGKKFRELSVGFGALAKRYDEAILNDEIDRQERVELEAIAAGIHRTVAELLALSFRVHCRDQSLDGSQ